MKTTIRSYADFDLRGSLLFGQNNNSFPDPARFGETVLKDGVLWIYSNVEGLLTWYPLTNKKNSFVHTQGIPSFQWTVAHGLGSVDLVFAAYDDEGGIMHTQITPIDPNSFYLNFTSAMAGRVVVFADAEKFSASIQAGGIHADTLSVANGVITGDSTGLKINNIPVLTSNDLVWSSIADTPTTLAGFGVADAYTQVQTQALIATASAGSTATAFSVSSLSASGNILPTGLNQTIGSPSARFKAIYVDEAYLAMSTLYLDGVAVMNTTASDVHLGADPGQGIRIETTGLGDVLIQSDNHVLVQTIAANSDVTLRTTGADSRTDVSSAVEVRINAPALTLTGATSFDGPVTIAGNFTVTGTTTTVNSTNVTTADSVMVLNSGEAGNGVTAGMSGLEIDRGGLVNVRLAWNESTQEFVMGEVGSETAIPTSNDLDLKADVSVTLTKVQADLLYLSTGIIIDGGIL